MKAILIRGARWMWCKKWRELPDIFVSYTDGHSRFMQLFCNVLEVSCCKGTTSDKTEGHPGTNFTPSLIWYLGMDKCFNLMVFCYLIIHSCLNFNDGLAKLLTLRITCTVYCQSYGNNDNQMRGKQKEMIVPYILETVQSYGNIDNQMCNKHMQVTWRDGIYWKL